MRFFHAPQVACQQVSRGLVVGLAHKHENTSRLRNTQYPIPLTPCTIGRITFCVIVDMARLNCPRSTAERTDCILEQVALMALVILAKDGFNFRFGQVSDALLRNKVGLHPVTLVLSIDEAGGVRSEAVHVPVGGLSV